MQIYPNRGKRKEDGRWVTGFFYEDTPLYMPNFFIYTVMLLR